MCAIKVGQMESFRSIGGKNHWNLWRRSGNASWNRASELSFKGYGAFWEMTMISGRRNTINFNWTTQKSRDRRTKILTIFIRQKPRAPAQEKCQSQRWKVKHWKVSTKELRWSSGRCLGAALSVMGYIITNYIWRRWNTGKGEDLFCLPFIARDRYIVSQPQPYVAGCQPWT